MRVITVARKPLTGTIARTAVEWETGCLNIDACRVECGTDHFAKVSKPRKRPPSGDEREGRSLGMFEPGSVYEPTNHPGGRWPPNVILEGAGVCEMFPESKRGHIPRSGGLAAIWGCGQVIAGDVPPNEGYGDSGSAARFFKQVIPCE